MKSLLTIAQDLHFQLYGEYFHDSQESNAQIIILFLQEMGKFTLANINDVDVHRQLEIPSDKFFLSSVDSEFYKLLNYE